MKQELNLSPIVLFVYNRLDHTKQTVEALQKNELANESELFIYSDAAKNESALEKVNEVRKYIKTINGFKKVEIIEREKNWGLANSIIDGVTKIVNEYGKIIVLEDDLVTSPYFLKFMNEALEVYKDEKNVYSITGYSFTDEVANIDSTYFLSIISSWSWATWAEKWSIFEKNHEKLKLFIEDKSNHKKFNFDNSYDYISMAKNNLMGKNDSWAIHWYFCVFQREGLTLYPNKKLVSNIGFDGSGVHCGNADNDAVPVNFYMPILTENIIEKEWNRKIVNNILLSKKENIFSRINKKRKYFLKNMFFINIKLREELLKK